MPSDDLLILCFRKLKHENIVEVIGITFGAFYKDRPKIACIVMEILSCDMLRKIEQNRKQKAEVRKTT